MKPSESTALFQDLTQRRCISNILVFRSKGVRVGWSVFRFLLSKMGVLRPLDNARACKVQNNTVYITACTNVGKLIIRSRALAKTKVSNVNKINILGNSLRDSF